MFKLNALAHPLKVQDYDLWIFTDLIQTDFLAQLIANYPTKGFKREPPPADNPNTLISFDNLDVLVAGNLTQSTSQGIHPIWQQFYSALNSEQYLSALGQHTGCDLSQAEVKIEFIRYHPGGFLSKHYDRQPGKVLAQVFYFNFDWHCSEGGFFDLLTSSEPHLPVFSLIPDKLYSTVIKSTPRAWHEVKKITGKRIRKIVNVEYIIK